MTSNKVTGLLCASFLLLTFLTSTVLEGEFERAPKDDEGCGPRPETERPV